MSVQFIKMLISSYNLSKCDFGAKNLAGQPELLKVNEI